MAAPSAARVFTLHNARPRASPRSRSITRAGRLHLGVLEVLQVIHRASPVGSPPTARSAFVSAFERAAPSSPRKANTRRVERPYATMERSNAFFGGRRWRHRRRTLSPPPPLTEESSTTRRRDQDRPTPCRTAGRCDTTRGTPAPARALASDAGPPQPMPDSAADPRSRCQTLLLLPPRRCRQTASQSASPSATQDVMLY